MMRIKPVLFWVLLSLVSLAGGSLVAVSTPMGPGVGGDATIYIVAARNLISGDGLGWINPDGTFQLLADFPPGYPLLLALGGLLGQDLIETARWINIFLFIALIWLTGFLVYRATRSFLYPLLAAALMSASPVLLPVYSWAMSEPLFLMLGVLTVLFLMQTLTRRSACYLILGAFTAGFALLTRYSGVAFLASGSLALLLLDRSTTGKRLRQTFGFLLVGSLPMMGWLIINYLSTGLIASRQIGTGQGLSAILSGFWNAFSETLLYWVMPDSWVLGARFPQVVYRFIPILILLGLLLWSLLVFRRMTLHKAAEEYHTEVLLYKLLILFSGVYLLVIFAIRFTVFPIIAINSRMLAPFYLMVLILGVMLCAFTSRFWLKGRLKGLILPAMLGLAVLWYAWISVNVANQLSKDGLGFTARSWQNSALINAVKQLPEDMLLVTNEPKAVVLLTDRTAYTLEEIHYRESLNDYTRYGEGDLSQDEGQRAFREEGAALVLFDTIESQLHRLYQERTSERVSHLTEGLREYLRTKEGAIFFYP